MSPSIVITYPTLFVHPNVDRGSQEVMRRLMGITRRRFDTRVHKVSYIIVMIVSKDNNINITLHIGHARDCAIS